MITSNTGRKQQELWERKRTAGYSEEQDKYQAKENTGIDVISVGEQRPMNHSQMKSNQ